MSVPARFNENRIDNANRTCGETEVAVHVRSSSAYFFIIPNSSPIADS